MTTRKTPASKPTAPSKKANVSKTEKKTTVTSRKAPVGFVSFVGTSLRPKNTIAEALSRKNAGRPNVNGVSSAPAIAATSSNRLASFALRRQSRMPTTAAAAKTRPRVPALPISCAASSNRAVDNRVSRRIATRRACFSANSARPLKATAKMTAFVATTMPMKRRGVLATDFIRAPSR